MRLSMILAALLLAAASADASTIIAPQALLSEEYVYNSAVNTINGEGLNSPIPDGGPVSHALGITHVYHGGWSGSFATIAPGGGGSDFFASIAPDSAVELVYDLTGGDDVTIGSVLFWQYENSGGGANRTGNHARTVEIRVNSEAQGSTDFAGPPVTLTLLPVTDGDADPGNDLGGVNSAQGFTIGPLDGRYVQLAITDNYLGHQGITIGGDRVGLGELRFGSEALPEYEPEDVWLMVVHAHPDDEGIFFGGVLPYYSQVLRLPTLLVNMTTGWLNADGSQTTDSETREAELREAAVRYGLEGEPVFALFQQTNWNVSIDQSWDRWADHVTDGDDIDEGKRRSSRRLAELIRAHRPEVIAAHDFGGEYGHPDHKATAHAAQAAWHLAAGREATIDDGVTPPTLVMPDGLVGEPWEASKVYIHGHGENPLFHEHWETVSIDATGDGTPDATPRQVANHALDAHVSQGQPKVATVFDPIANGGNSWDAYPSEWWGLLASTVGPDDIAPDFTIEGQLYSGWARGDFTQNVPGPPATSCHVDVAALDFGGVAVGDTATAEFVVTNDGEGVLAGTAVLEGGNCEGFSIVPGTESYSLYRGRSQAVVVRFAPSSASLNHDCVVAAGHELCGGVALQGTVTGAAPVEPPMRLSAHPNPFNPQVTIRFALDRDEAVQLSVYDLAGRRLRVLSSGNLAAGSHAVSWDGHDASGRPLASGIYLLRLKAESTTQVEKLTLIR